LRVLYLSATGILGGAERVLLNVMTAVRRRNAGFRPSLLALGDGPLPERARAAGIPTTVLPLPPRLSALGDSQLSGTGRVGRWVRVLAGLLRAAPAMCGYLRRLARQLRQLAPELIHSNGIKTHLLLRLARVRGIPILWHAHDLYRERPLAGRLLRWARKDVSGVLAVSQAVADDLSDLLPGLPVRVVRNTVDVSTFAPAAAEGGLLDTAAGMPAAPPGTVRVGLVATYARWKGQDLFLQAIALLRQHPLPVPVRYYLIGGPIYGTEGSQFTETELRALAEAQGVTDQVAFVPFRQDPASVFQSLDIVVHASTRPEPFGLTIAEGMACGRAVVVAAAGGARELFRHGEDALGFPPRDAPALAAAIRTLILDPELRHRLGHGARETAVLRFNNDHLGPEIAEAYASLRPAGSLRRPAVSTSCP
jgi:glycosyltransferase involved in cell wall biosynthesis